MPQYNAALRETILKIVDNQLQEESLPEVKQTFERLIATGHSQKEAKRLIANVLIYEIFTVMKQKKEFNQPRYVAALQKLPELPDEDEYVAS